MGKIADYPERGHRLIDRARVVFETLAKSHRLELEWDETAPVELAAWLRKQPGLDWDLLLNLQNVDEIGVQHYFFYVEWFPADDPDQEAKFIAAVDGLLSGAVRLRCSFAGAQELPYRVQFQREVDGEWSTFYTYRLGLHVGRPSLVSIMQNGHPNSYER